MRDVLRGLKPDRFEDIIAVVALYRPGRWKISRPISAVNMAAKMCICMTCWNPSCRSLRDYDLPNRFSRPRVIWQAIRWRADCCAARWARKSKKKWTSSGTFLLKALGNGIDAQLASDIFDQIAYLRDMDLINHMLLLMLLSVIRPPG